MMNEDQKLNYKEIFKEYPDVVNTEQMCEMLGNICIKTGYQLLKNKEIYYFHIGHKYLIPKICIIDYILSRIQYESCHKIESST